MDHLSKAVVDKWQEESRQFHDSAQLVYDDQIDKLMKQKERANIKANQRLKVLEDRLTYVQKLEGDEL